MTLLEKFKLYWYKNKYTKVKIWQTDTRTGFIVYDIKHEEHKYIMQYYDDIKVMTLSKANKLLNKRSEKVSIKYYGPRYIRDGYILGKSKEGKLCLKQ